ncbi:MAG: ABC transporter permease, partial [Bacteroidota bacterium]
MLRNKFFSVINILGLSVGLACCMLIFLYAKDEVSFDQFHANKDHIYRITADLINSKRTDKQGSTGMMPGPEFKRNLPEIVDFVRIKPGYFNIKQGNDVLEQEVLYADDNFFSVFSFPFIYGNPTAVLKDLHSVVISESFAQKSFGKQNPMGKLLELNIDEAWVPFVVTGVMKNAPQNSSIKPEMVLPMKFSQSKYDDKQWLNFFLNTFVVLKPGTDLKLLEQKMDRLYLSEAKEQIKEAKSYGMDDRVLYHLQPLTEIHLSTDYGSDNGLTNGSNPVYSYILVAIAAFILVIACINFVNLTVARSLKRAKEIGIRKAVGGQRQQLIFQFLSESFMLVFISFVMAITLVIVLLPLFNKVSGKALSFSYLIDANLMAGYAGLFVLTGILAGFYPALVISGFNPVETLYGKFRFTGKNRLSKSLIVFQFTLTTFLIIATLTIYSQFNFLMNYDLGIRGDNVVSVNTPDLKLDKLELLKAELSKEPSIESVTAEQAGSWNTIAHINGETEQNFNFKHVDDNYFSLFKIPFTKGRNFSVTSPDSSESLIVNEAFVKAAGWADPIGQTIDFWYQSKKYKVIGVIKDYHFEALTAKIIPQVFNIDNSYSYRKVFIKLKEGKKAQGLSYLEKIFRKSYPMQPYQYKWWDEEQKSNYESEAKWKQIVTLSAILTIFISCIGLFGLAALSAEKRAKEIGIRKVLGASSALIVKKLSLDFMWFIVL